MNFLDSYLNNNLTMNSRIFRWGEFFSDYIDYSDLELQQNGLHSVITLKNINGSKTKLQFYTRFLLAKKVYNHLNHHVFVTEDVFVRDNEKINYTLVRDNNDIIHIGRRLPSEVHNVDSPHSLISQCGYFKLKVNEKGNYLTMDNKPTCNKCMEQNNILMEIKGVNHAFNLDKK